MNHIIKKIFFFTLYYLLVFSATTTYAMMVNTQERSAINSLVLIPNNMSFYDESSSKNPLPERNSHSIPGAIPSASRSDNSIHRDSPLFVAFSSIAKHK